MRVKYSAVFKWVPFSIKQLKVLNWWMEGSPHADDDGIIAHGAIRSGKTLIMSFSFVIWAMETFSGQNFIMAGKTIGSFNRNVLFWLKIVLRLRGYKVHQVGEIVEVLKNRRINFFHIFGGKDERSQDLAQGFTAAGAFLDEVVLMPESFVNQVVARCSVDGSKLWFNCNPGGPKHWFKTNWIDKAKTKRLYVLHFELDDNPSLSEAVKARYRRNFSGVFYDRYVLGLWVMAEGIIFSMFNPKKHLTNAEQYKYSEYIVSIDYGTMNPFAMSLWGHILGTNKWVKIREYYHQGREDQVQKTDEEYYADLEEFVGKKIFPRYIVIDPSAASFIATIKKHNKFSVKRANNDVLNGIRNMATALTIGIIMYDESCKFTVMELESYVWDAKAAEKEIEEPLKMNDHLMDGDRYFVNTVIFKGRKGVIDIEAA